MKYRIRAGCFTFEIDKLTGRHEQIDKIEPKPGEWKLTDRGWEFRTHERSNILSPNAKA